MFSSKEQEEDVPQIDNYNETYRVKFNRRIQLILSATILYGKRELNS